VSEKPSVSYVFEHKAADKLMIDFAGNKLYLTDYETGEQVPVEFCGYSSL
jgi:hypothetical protein